MADSPELAITCASCGSPTSSRSRISSLENEVRVLTEQSVDALTRLSNYEEEIRRLRIQRSVTAPSLSSTATATPADPQHSYNTSVDSATSASAYTGLNRFASFRMGRKPSATSNPSVDLGDLQTQLAKETSARQEAEQKADKLNAELEDLSANLFEQANEMVATERRARSKLEERVATLEQREKARGKRLEKIESALKRLERVRALLAPPSPP